MKKIKQLLSQIARNISGNALVLVAAGMPVITWTIRSPQQAVMAMRCSDQITFEGFAA